MVAVQSQFAELRERVIIKNSKDFSLEDFWMPLQYSFWWHEPPSTAFLSPPQTLRCPPQALPSEETKSGFQYTIMTKIRLHSHFLASDIPSPGLGWGGIVFSFWFDNYCSRLVSEPFYNQNSASPFAANIWSGDERRQKGFKSYAGQLCSGAGVGATVVWRGSVLRVWLFASFGNCWDVRSHIVSITFYSFLFNSLPNVSAAHRDSWTWFETEATVAPPGFLGAHLADRVWAVIGHCFSFLCSGTGLRMVSKASSPLKTKGEPSPPKSSH